MIKKQQTKVKVKWPKSHMEYCHYFALLSLSAYFYIPIFFSETIMQIETNFVECSLSRPLQNGISINQKSTTEIKEPLIFVCGTFIFTPLLMIFTFSLYWTSADFVLLLLISRNKGITIGAKTQYFEFFSLVFFFRFFRVKMYKCSKSLG